MSAADVIAGPGARFVRPAPTVVSGGTVYDEAVLRVWPGRPPEDVVLEGDWPDGPGTASRLADALRGASDAVVDGLVGAAHPDVLRDAQAAGTTATLLVHLPLPDETGLTPERTRELAAREAESVALVSRVVATSRTAAADLARRYGRTDVEVAPPGVDPSLTSGPAAVGSSPPRVLCLASLTPRKNHVGLLAALARLTDLPWHAVFAGPGDDTDRARITDAIATTGLGDRVTLTGPLAGADLEETWAGTDVLALPSLAETYGMVVTEAIAHGVPAVVAAGTGAVEALGDGDGPDPGLAADTRNPADLARALRTVLTHPEFREFARRRRTGLRSWSATAALLAGVFPADVGPPVDADLPIRPDPESTS
ncbi:glycosyltransferase family 4 protein [Mobilicoccus pelagius]|nr:glycosyltransferase family 4 protein [Mobilicoccus pelagius]